ncbi:MAG TPA: AEC family transporter [Candidatus Lokiarchaeia archaeon]|nr:AEC family transporter [Candidatus Lokiarchaeia archaeon]
MADINTTFFLSLILIAAGYIVKRLNVLNERDGEGLAKVILNVTLPALILDRITHIQLEASFAILPVIAIVYSLPVVLIPYFLFRNEPREVRGNMMFVTVGWNIGLFAYPMIQSIYGTEGFTYIAMFDMGNSLIIFGLCYVIAVTYSPSGAEVSGKVIAKKLLTLIPLMSYVVALVVNLAGWQFPDLVATIFTYVGDANGPLVLILLGIYLNFTFDQKDWQYIGKVLVIRYVAGFCVGLLLFFTLPFNLLARLMVFIGLILPIGMAVVPYSVQYEFNRKLTGTLVNFSIVISFALMWLILSLVPIT